MGKVQKPSGPVTPEMYEWGAEFFNESRLRFVAYNRRLALRMHSKDGEVLDRLVEFFGGRYTPVASTNQYMLYGELLREFLVGIRPFLTKAALQRAVQGEEILALQPVTAKDTEHRILQELFRAADAPPTEAEAEPARDREIDAEIPGHGPFAEDEPVLELARMQPVTLYHAQSEAAAQAFGRAARAVGMQAEVEGLFVRILRTEAAV